MSCAVGEKSQQLVALRHCTRAVGGDEVAEEVAHHLLPLGADALERRLGVLRQGTYDPADLLVSRASQELPLPIPPLPQARDGEGQERQCTADPLHGVDHLHGERLVLEPVASLLRRLHQGPQQPLAAQRRQRRQVQEDACQSLLLGAPDQEVVPQRQQHVHVRLARQAPQQLREPPLHLGRVQREQLLELVHHQDRVPVAFAPPAHHLERHLGVVDVDQLPEGLRVA
jgi:hypothetical protein